MLAEPTVMNGHVSHGTDRAALVRFYKFEIHGMVGTKTQDFIEIISPGDTKSEMRRQVQDSDKIRWPDAWRAYEAGEEFKAQGTPLEQWREIDSSMIRELNHKHIYTIEQLANLGDTGIDNVGMGARMLVAKAKAFIEVNKDAEAVGRYAAQFESIKSENELLQDENRKLAARLQALEDRLHEEPKKTLTLPKK